MRKLIAVSLLIVPFLFQQQEQKQTPCGPTYFKIQGGIIYACQICYTSGGGTELPYEDCKYIGPLPS